MSIAILNTTSDISGKTVVTAEGDRTITGLLTFNRGAGAPFAVPVGAASVSNLDADKLDGQDWTSGVTQIQAGTGSNTAPTYSFNGDANTGVYRSGADALDFTTGGTKALGIDSTQFIDSPTQPRASVYNNTTQSLNDATKTALTFNTEDYDVGGLHDTSSNTSRMTIPAGGDGLYLVIGQVSYAANATGARSAFIKKNGSTEWGYTQAGNAGGSRATIVQVHTLMSLAAADYVELFGFQESGGALNTGSATREISNILQIVKIW